MGALQNVTGTVTVWFLLMQKKNIYSIYKYNVCQQHQHCEQPTTQTSKQMFHISSWLNPNGTVF